MAKRGSTARILGIRVKTPPAIGAGPKANLQSLLGTFCERWGFSTAEVLQGGNRAVLVEIRRAFSIEARRQGYSFPEIGRALARHHSSIIYLVRK